MHYVYLLRSINFPKEYYVRLTTSLKERVKQHNQGISTHTAKFRPWKLIVYIGFVEELDARKFEKYLKSGSGREFSRRHFQPTLFSSYAFLQSKKGSGGAKKTTAGKP